MSLLELATHLRAVAASGGVTLDRATLTENTNLTLPETYDAVVRDAFGFGASESWTLTVKPEQIPDPSGNELRITLGVSTFTRLALTAVALDLRFSVSDGATALKVTAEIALDINWNFASSFPMMRGYPFAQVPYKTPTFVFASEHFDSYAAAPAPVALDPGLNFASVLKIEGILDPVRRFVALSQDTFAFFGTISVTASPVMPALKLRATLGGTLIAIGALRISAPFIELRVQYSAQTGRRSIVFVFGMQLDVGAGVTVAFTAQILRKPIEMVLAVAEAEDRPMTPDALFALVGGQSWGDAIPAPLRTALQSVAFKDLEARTSLALPPVLNTLTTRVGSTKPLQLFDEFTLDEFDVVWVLERDGDAWESQVQLVAWFKFYPELFDGEFEIGVSSEMQIWGSFTGAVSLAKLLATITKGLVAPPSSSIDFVLTDFGVALDVPRKSFSLTVGGSGIFDPLGSGLLVLNSVSITLASAASTTERTYDANLNAVLVMAGLPLAVTASYVTGAGWDFLAVMPAGASVSIGDFLQRLFPTAVIPSFLDQVSVSNARLAAHAGGITPGSIETAATIQLRNINLGPLGNYTIDANFQLKHVAGATPVTSGGFTFGTTIPGIGARVTIGYAFTSNASKIVTVTWGVFKAEYDITKSLLTFSVGEATLGGVLGQIVGLIIGDDGYRLPPPWSVLNELSLRGLAIVYDFDKKTVSVDYSLPSPIHLGFLTINGLTIEKKDKITVALDATFIGGEKVPAFDPLDKPPDVPGGAPIDLRLLALGQRVTVPGIEKSKNIDAAIKLLASFTDTPGSGLPVGPTFSASSPWLVGIHLLVMGATVEIEVVFVDPLLYGLRIALKGEKAGPFKGLDFEILYKRVTDTIGVYQIRLTLPDTMRFLQFGVLAITLPLVALDIYTNGDFKIDFGFPWNMDFSRSFGVQYFPFTGAGGFYFAKLSGATQTAIGKPSVAGTFDPVIQFGLGLQIGLGKDISAGVLKAGISITVFGIVEGIIARWVPANTTDETAHALAPMLPACTHGDGLNSVEQPVRLTTAAAADPHDVGSSYYYKISGTIGVIGKVYGSIDFAIIKASLNLTITITLQAVIEAHQPFLVAISASVDVSLSVSINLYFFSITIHFSFKTTIRESFTLGQATDAPWGTLGPALPPPQLKLRAQQFALEQAAHIAALDYTSLAFADDERAEIDLTFVMHPSVASDPADATTATGKLVAMLYVDAPDPGASPPPLPPADKPLSDAPTSFERFAETIFLWVVAAFGGAGAAVTRKSFLETTVTRARIAAAYSYLSATTNQRPISYDDDIVPGLYPNLKFVVSAQQTVQNAAPFPMIPELRLVAGNVNRRFADGLKVDDNYLDSLRTYFEQIAARYQNDLQKKYNNQPQAQLMSARTSATTSFSAAVVEDVVLMLARGMTKSALDVMDGYAYPYGGKQLDVIVAEINALGNSLTVAQLAGANKTLTLASGTALTLTRVGYQLAAADSFAKIVAGFGITDAAAILSDAANATQGGVLRPGVTLTAGMLSYLTQPEDTFGGIVSKQAGWTYAALADALKASPDAILPLAVLILPVVVYTTTANDSLTTLANSFGLDLDAVAEAVAGVGNLYADTDGKLELTVPDLIALSPGLLLGRMRAKEAAANLAGANARFLLYGMRPPSPLATLDSQGAPAALYDLNSQQLDLPGADLATLSIDAAQPWITFNNGPTPLSVQLDITAANSLATGFVGIVKAQGVPAQIDAIMQLPAFHDDARRYTLRRTALLQAAEPLVYPFDTGTQASAATPRLWYISEAMARALAASKRLLPAFTLEATSSGNPPETTLPQRYGWTTIVDIEIKRRDDLPATYEVFGSDEIGTALLESLITPGLQANIFGIELLTGANATGQAPSGYADAGLSKVRAYLVKTNLSTETNPRMALAAMVAAQPKMTGILNDPLDFVRLLWEASVTRNGGFALTYRRDDGSGFPASIFANGDTATISVMILHAPDGARIHHGVNAALIGDGFDPARYNLAAVSAKQSVAYVADGSESLDDIVAAYRIRITTLGAAAAQARLSPTAVLNVSGIIHQVQGATKSDPAVETLDQIANFYGVSAEQIKDLNPGVSFAPLPARTLLLIPGISRTGAQYQSLAALSEAFGVGAGQLALTNSAVPGIFAASNASLPNSFTFDDQLVDRLPTMSPGNVGFVLSRDNPGTGGDAATTLAAQFNMLGFRVAGNLTFNVTSDALPVSPTLETDATTRRELHLFAGATDWRYTQALYVADAAKNAVKGDPYAGVGSYAQVAFALRDMFGNLAASALTESSLAPPQPQNDAPFRVAYTDALFGIGSWPSVGVDYRFYRRTDTQQRVLALGFTFDVSRYTPDSAASPSTNPDDVPAWQQRALADQAAFATIAWQLSAPGVTLGVGTTMDGGAQHFMDAAAFATFAIAAADYLGALVGGESSPILPIMPQVEIEVAPTNPADIFALDVSVVVARPASQVDVAFLGSAAERISTLVSPRSAVKQGADTGALAAFAQDLESAYIDPDIFLKVATGRSQRGAADDSTIHLVRLRTTPGAATDPGIGFAVNGPARYYAPRPLANVLISRADVPILKYDPQTGIDWNNPTETALSGIAMDTWGRTALAALDRFLSPDFAGAAFLIDHVDPDKNGYLQQILQVKADLAADIASTLEPILQLPPLDPNDSAPLDDAAETMRQQILGKTENAYIVSAVCQFRADVSSKYVNDPEENVYAPRFYGTIGASLSSATADTTDARPWSFTSARPVLAPESAFVTTALTVVDPTAQSHLPLDLNFKLSNIEYDIAKGVDGEYLASSWLSFVIPLESEMSGATSINTRIGAADIPIVLRAIPPAPSLNAQDAIPTPDTDPDTAKAFEQAKRWSYAFTYEKDVVAQDTIDCSVMFNLDDGDANLALVARPLDLFDYLARFVTIFPAMLSTMVELLVPDRLDLDPASDAYKRARTLVGDFYQLLKPIPAAWALWHARVQRKNSLAAHFASPQISEFAFSIQEQDVDDLLVAQRTLGENTAQVWNPDTNQLVPLPPPQLTIDDGTTIWTGTPDLEDPNRFTFTSDGETLTYSAAEKLRRRRPIFAGLADGLDIAAYQNAWSAVQVFRNRDLVRDADGKIIPTTPDFVYSTPQIRFASRVTPSLLRTRLYDIAALSSPPLQTLATHISRVMATLFEGTAPGTQQYIRFDGEYAQKIGDDLPSAIVPIFLGVPTKVTLDEATTLATNAADYIEQWFDDNRPPDGSFRFTLTLFPTRSNSRLPLLQMTQLTLARSDVSGLPTTDIR